MISARGWAAHSPTSPLVPFSFERRDPGPHDVQIKIRWCGICHSDLHQARDDWDGSLYPMVPGHEIVGDVVATGAQVTRVKRGDAAAVGCMVDSCRTCRPCKAGLEQYCDEGATWTYNCHERDGVTLTQGGYSDVIVVDEAFVLAMPNNLDLSAAAPLLCAGITTWSPLVHWKTGPGMEVGVAGIGGLGHMGIKLARALGARVVAITTSPAKAAEAHRLGAHEVLLSTDAAAMERNRRRFPLVLDTIPVSHDVTPYLDLLDIDGSLVIVGAFTEIVPPPRGTALVGGRKRLTGSGIGGIRETQEMLDFCGTHGITADVERIDIATVNEAWARMQRGDVRYRFVIDMATL